MSFVIVRYFALVNYALRQLRYSQRRREILLFLSLKWIFFGWLTRNLSILSNCETESANKIFNEKVKWAYACRVRLLQEFSYFLTIIEDLKQ